MHKTAVLRYFLLFIIGGLGLVSCSKYSKLEKVRDWKVLYAAANEYFDKKDYRRAADLYDRVLPDSRGTNEGELAQYRIALANYNQKLYILSSYYFKIFVEVYNRSDKAEEAAFLQAKSLYLDSPIPSLDQQNTREALATLQNFLNRYQTSEYAPEATQMIISLQQKLEKKYYDIAKLYWKLSQGIFPQSYLDASLVAFENFEREFPDSNYREEIAYLKVEANYLIAKNSVDDKKAERFRAAIDSYNEFLIFYPGSKFGRQAQDVYSACLKELTNLSNKNS
jgi:outer membrane protein assembly factor BamD